MTELICKTQWFQFFHFSRQGGRKRLWMRFLLTRGKSKSKKELHYLSLVAKKDFRRNAPVGFSRINKAVIINLADAIKKVCPPPSLDIDKEENKIWWYDGRKRTS